VEPGGLSEGGTLLQHPGKQSVTVKKFNSVAKDMACKS
jgi:hypothetical protein